MASTEAEGSPRLIGVSPGRLYRAIADGRLTAAPGGRTRQAYPG
jgi:hypothetical protein